MESIDPYKLSMVAVFAIGYLMIAFEHLTKINKATVALLMAIVCWVIQFSGTVGVENTSFLVAHLANISQVIFFLIGAVAIVEIIDTHQGFRLISDSVNINSKRSLLWAIGLFAFFLSAILDNLTTTILMISILSKIVKPGEDRWIIGGGVVIAANAGGAWTPIGDITTTMLWIGGQISTLRIMWDLLLPSFVCLVASLFVLSFMLKGNFPVVEIKPAKSEPILHSTLIFCLGVGALVFVPVFKVITGLPPFMGVLFGLSVLWIVTDFLYRNRPETETLQVPYILSKVDLSTPLFFLGILLSINALETAGLLEMLAKWIDSHVSNVNVVAAFIGLASAVVDNVPLVAACMGMYDLATYPVDSPFWELVAYCAGTGGSILIIGSAAGVAYMSLEKVDFFWYLKRISLSAFVGYFAGMAAYLLIG
jgi:NhaD family Na+/H+ antiporter